MPAYELMAYLSFWAMPIAYLFSVGGCCGPGTGCGAGIPCDGCNADTEPISYQVEVGGCADHGTPVCEECDDWNATWQLNQPPIGEGGTACEYIQLLGLPCASETDATALIQYIIDFFSPSLLNALDVVNVSISRDVIWNNNESQPADCCRDGFTLTYNSGFSDEINCDWSSSTCVVTAVT